MDSETNGSLEAGLASAVQRAQTTLRDQFQSYEESVRKSPGSSLLVAAAAGYVFRNVPIGALLGGLIRLILALVRPGLFLYVAAKGYELMQRGVLSGSNTADAGPGEPSRRRSRARSSAN
jgi:hypothetical protein